jgi:hypothetical protein
VGEMKCRNMTHEHFKKAFNSQWLLTFEKIVQGVVVAKELQVSYIGMLYLEPSSTLLVKTIWNPHYGFRAPFGVRNTETQATVNGGKVFRDNAYIDMTDAMVLTMINAPATPKG